jgi:hypothetical protein
MMFCCALLISQKKREKNAKQKRYFLWMRMYLRVMSGWKSDLNGVEGRQMGGKRVEFG